ncbi:MAG TPA: aminoacyl-tRNA hydrolase [Humisphaera sp.]|jgi:PTH1 family peptidyl-tRNA hydrolase|nr:aminoacyl-tRNA hydrolase [Humisphaera sp.]
MRLIVGLGNPGREYVGTRHNIGFEVIDRLSQRLGWTFSAGEFDRLAKTKFDGLAMDGATTAADGQSLKLLLLKPLTYMNLSGKSVQAAMAFYQLSPADVMIVLDDLALPCGRIRLRPGGSNGGHNGLRDIERALATSEYPRLRLGIDAPPPRVPGKDYVLGRFSDEQQKQIGPAVDRAASAVLCWAENGIQTAMNRFNADEQ